MKYVAVLLLGIVTGALVAAGFLFYNPLTSRAAPSPLSVGGREQLTLKYSAVPVHSIAFTNDGESRIQPHPERILQLWEAPIRRTEILVTVLRGEGNEPVGLGIKFSSHSEQTRLLNGEALVDSVWHVYLPRRGTLLVGQTENYWNYLREVVAPAHWSSGNSWKGDWHGTMTSGPGALGTADVHGGGGVYRGLEAEAIEMLTARAYSAERGPVAMEGLLTIEFPPDDAGVAPDAD